MGLPTKQLYDELAEYINKYTRYKLKNTEDCKDFEDHEV
jgi:hypothetical protein